MQRPFFGFIRGHSYLGQDDLKTISTYLKTDEDSIVKKFKSEFSKIVSNGIVVSYASGRMAFYDLMKAFGINSNNEVILSSILCGAGSSIRLSQLVNLLHISGMKKEAALYLNLLATK